MRTLPFAAVLCLALRAVGPVAAQEERVEIELPAQIVLEGSGLDAGPFDPSRPTLVKFRQAQLPPGHVLRFSLRLEDAPPGSDLLFATHNARGGIGRGGRAGTSDFIPVFESFPRTPFGEVEISWTLKTLGTAPQAGRRMVTLRWRIESVSTRNRPGGGAVPGMSPRLSGESLLAAPGPEERGGRLERQQGIRPPREEVP
jgi:hypothetical protein